jgi:hypothetical protein
MGKGILISFGLFLSVVSYGQRQAFGLRLGDPIGITYKKYTQTNKAIEFLFGTASTHWRHNYYENSFSKYSEYDGYSYRSHKLSNPVYLQARYLFHYHIPVDGMDGKLEWYWGVGAMLKFCRVEYRYADGPPDNGNKYDTRTSIDFGPDGILGVEYKFEDTPLNVFGEVSLLLELADRPLTPQLFGAVGARFIF